MVNRDTCTVLPAEVNMWDVSELLLYLFVGSMLFLPLFIPHSALH